MEWTVEFYKDVSGNEPAIDFIDSLSEEGQAKILRYIQLLLKYGVLLKEPYTRRVEGKIREVRTTDQTGKIRILYFTYTGKRFVLLHGFIKKAKKTPPEDIKIAQKRMDDFLRRCSWCKAGLYSNL